MTQINDDFLMDDDTIDWQNGLAHLNDVNFDTLYNPNHHLLGQRQYQGNNNEQIGDGNNGNCNNQNGDQQQNENLDETKVSDALTYGPKFCQLFWEFSQTLPSPINPERHLMALCTEYLVLFCKWARESEEKTTAIRATLLEYYYLRPEVRNGLVMVIIYTFASSKSARDNGIDMFNTLQDTERGLGINNKFSLKIYNDPFMYLSFLKITISALIDAGAIPDNERVNQPKRFKAMVENKEELDAYDQIQKRLVSLLDTGDNAGAKHMVLLITNYWQQRAKFIRNRRFVSVLQALGSMPATVPRMLTTQSSSSSNSSSSSSNSSSSYIQGNGSSASELNQNPLCHAVGTISTCCGACGAVPGSGGHTHNQMGLPMPLGLQIREEEEQMSKRMRLLSSVDTLDGQGQGLIQTTNKEGDMDKSNGNRRRSPRPIDVLRFERVGTHEWNIVETKVYDVCEFMKMLSLDTGDTPVCLIDESVLQNSIGFIPKPKKMASKMGFGGVGYKSSMLGVMSLTKELTNNSSLVTSWTKADRGQLKEMVCQYQWQKQLPNTKNDLDSISKDETMITFWRSNDTTDFSEGNSCECHDCQDGENNHNNNHNSSSNGNGNSHSSNSNGSTNMNNSNKNQHNSNNNCNSTNSVNNNNNSGNAIQNIPQNGRSNGDNNTYQDDKIQNNNQNYNSNGNQNVNNNQNDTIRNNYNAANQQYSSFTPLNNVNANSNNNKSNNFNQNSSNNFNNNTNYNLNNNNVNGNSNKSLNDNLNTSSNYNQNNIQNNQNSHHLKPKGYLVYEKSLQVGIVIRTSKSLGINEDLWCVLFPTELTPINATESFGMLLSRMFPQLKALYGKKGNHADINDFENNTTVKYYPHYQKEYSLHDPPMAPDNQQCYRTIGTASVVASTLLARVAEGPTFHDFVLSSI